MTQRVTKAEFAEIAAYLSAGVSRPMGAKQMEVYFDALSDFPADVLQVAAKRALQETEDNWLPAVGRIRRLATEAVLGVLPQAGPEWDAVLTAVRRFGHTRGADGMAGLSPLAQQAVKAVGGWVAICDSENIGILHSQFRAAYEGLAKRESELRRISPELRPAITAGPQVARIQSDPWRVAGDLAKRMTVEGDR